MDASYSVIIRTLGTAGAKYQRLLDSIACQTIRPLEVIVVLPHGYEKPKEQLGWETFVYTEKGMVNQRAEGIKRGKGDYFLIVDDDIEFERDFVTNIFDILHNIKGDVLCPAIRSIENLEKGLKTKIKHFSLDLFLKITGRRLLSKKNRIIELESLILQVIY